MFHFQIQYFNFVPIVDTFVVVTVCSYAALYPAVQCTCCYEQQCILKQLALRVFISNTINNNESTGIA